DVDLKQTRFYQEVFTEGKQEGFEEGHEEGDKSARLRIAHSLLDIIQDDRVLAQHTGLTELEIQQLRKEK
ncbi:flagellar assembly protein H, partial [Thiospirillum jenense]|nr:flagellar assembly protein H [Thiospirillum jenense]